MKTVGIILVIVGLLFLIFTGINFRQEKTIAKVGDLELTGEEEQRVNWSPWAGAAIMVVGGILIFAGSKQPR
jgi:uncharacterized membrane protein YdcZ (DUF606 family)